VAFARIANSDSTSCRRRLDRFGDERRAGGDEPAGCGVGGVMAELIGFALLAFAIVAILGFVLFRVTERKR
jgi:hypothetical protein